MSHLHAKAKKAFLLGLSFSHASYEAAKAGIEELQKQNIISSQDAAMLAKHAATVLKQKEKQTAAMLSSALEKHAQPLLEKAAKKAGYVTAREVAVLHKRIAKLEQALAAKKAAATKNQTKKSRARKNSNAKQTPKKN
ncbi:MAG: hypothetical protein QW594_02100 [Candidatus Woesearchaeota archaeon]